MNRPAFSSRLTMIFTLIGVAIGLGNVWRFPYMMGRYGGSAFLLIYLAFTFLFALPALMGEISFGRASRQGLLAAYRKAVGGKIGIGVGYLLLVTILVASSYYAIIIGNVVYSSFYALFAGFDLTGIERYEEGLQNGQLQYGISAGVVLTCLVVLQRGLNKGIEWISRLFVPFFLIVIVFMIYYTLSLEGAKTYFLDFLQPDFSSLKPVNIFAALGQAFYSLSLGGTFMVVYGGYLADDVSIPKTAAWTALGDVGAALLTSLFIVPAVLVFQLDLTAGPTLIFQTLPRLFAMLPGGHLIGAVFLLALSLVAFLSLVAALEVAFSCFKELARDRISPVKILMIIGAIELALIVPSTINGDLIGTLDLIFGSGMQVFGSGIALIAMCWGLGRGITELQLRTTHFRFRSTLYFWLRWVIPAVLLAVLIGYIYSTIS